MASQSQDCTGYLRHPFKKSLPDTDDAFQAPFLRTDVVSSQYRPSSRACTTHSSNRLSRQQSADPHDLPLEESIGPAYRQLFDSWFLGN
jgi:hypothetical protein